MSTSSVCSGFFVAGHCPGDSTNQVMLGIGQVPCLNDSLIFRGCSVVSLVTLIQRTLMLAATMELLERKLMTG